MIQAFLVLCFVLRCSATNENTTEDLGWTRQGAATRTHSCSFIRRIDDAPVFILRLGHYAKYTEAYGIPVVGSPKVSDDAMKRACYILRFMLGDREDLRQLVYHAYGRIAVHAPSETYADLPEYKEGPELLMKKGVPAKATWTVAATPEKNLLCMLGDSYLTEDITVRILGHLIVRIIFNGYSKVCQHLKQRIQNLHDKYKMDNFPKWHDTYATKSIVDWMAEATQSYFDSNHESQCPDSMNNFVNTRKELKAYDEDLYYIIRTMFPCQNILYDRCKEGEPPEPKMDCKIKPEKEQSFNSLLQAKMEEENKKKSFEGCYNSAWWNCPEEANKREDGCDGVMRFYCRKFCHQCKDCRKLDRKDHNPKCALWAEQGECQSTSDETTSYYVRHICRSSCPS